MRSNKGFTLTELLVYATIFVITAGLLTAILTNVTRVNNKQVASTEVAQQLNFVLATVQNLVNDASLIEAVYEGATEGTECSQFCTVRLRMASSTLDPTIVSSDANGVYLTQGAGATSTLTNPEITVDKFNLTKFEFDGGHASVRIDMAFTYNADNAQLAVTRSVQSAFGRAGAATFDDHVLPGGSYDIGQSASQWRDGYFSRNLFVVNSVAVGTTTVDASAILDLNSTTQGVLFPRMTESARDSISSPATGLIIYNTEDSLLNFYTGSTWSNIGNWSATGTVLYHVDAATVGIGTDSPDSTLTVYDSEATAYATSTADGQDGEGATLHIWNAANSNTTFAQILLENRSSGDYNARIGLTGGSTPRLFIGTTGAEHMTIEDAGNIGIGTTDPENVLHIQTANRLGSTFTGTVDGEGLRVDQTSYTSGDYLSLVEASYRSDQTAPHVRMAAYFDGSGSHLAFGTSNNYGSGITNGALALHEEGTVSGTYGTYHTSSDGRLKKNIKPLSGVLEKLSHIDGVSYEWVEAEEDNHTDGVKFGLIAQDVEAVFPEAVHVAEDEMRTKSIEYDQLAGVFVSAINEQQGEIEVLKDKLEELSGEDIKFEENSFDIDTEIFVIALLGGLIGAAATLFWLKRE